MSDILWRNPGKFSSAFYFFKNTWKLQNRDCFGRKTLDILINTTLLKFNCHLMPNLYLNIKQEIVLFEKCQISLFFTFRLLWISNLTVRKVLQILKIVSIVIPKGYGPSYEVKLFSQTVWKIFFRFIFF